MSRHVNWDPKKTNLSKQDFWAPCPFHQEKTASFHVDDTKGFYYCFGCQSKGNVFSFLKEMEGLSFFDAVKALSEKAGIPLEIDDNTNKKAVSAKTKHYSISMKQQINFMQSIFSVQKVQSL